MTQPGREGGGRVVGDVGKEMGGTEEELGDKKRTRVGWGRENGKVEEEAGRLKKKELKEEKKRE